MIKVLKQLSDLDWDGARIQNGIGFNKMDSNFGASLAGQVARTGSLSSRQVRAALRMVRKYKNQYSSELYSAMYKD